MSNTKLWWLVGTVMGTLMMAANWAQYRDEQKKREATQAQGRLEEEAQNKVKAKIDKYISSLLGERPVYGKGTGFFLTEFPRRSEVEEHLGKPMAVIDTTIYYGLPARGKSARIFNGEKELIIPNMTEGWVSLQFTGNDKLHKICWGLAECVTAVSRRRSAF